MEMAEYINRDAVIEAVMEKCISCKCPNCTASDILTILQLQPAADVAPVRHGRWKPGDMPTWYKCSVCGGNTVLYKATYCPHCGARMDGTEPQMEDEHGR